MSESASLQSHTSEGCPFCERMRDDRRVLFRNDAAAAFLDQFPVSDGHALVVPTRHVPDFFALSSEERACVMELVDTVRHSLNDRLHPDGFNIGLNVGGAAGQTVPHAHFHVIPRFAGDVVDPRGGVRWVIPERAAYWESGQELTPSADPR